MKTNLLLLLCVFCTLNIMSAQVGMGTSKPRGALDINREATNTYDMGLVLPTNTTPNNLINPQGGSVAPGTIMFDSTLNCVRVFKASGWSDCLCDNCGASSSFTLDCSNGALTGNYSSGTLSSGSKVVNYVNATGQAYGAISIASTGVTGLTATAPAGTLVIGNGSIVLAISGTPSSAGVAIFEVSIGGKTCTFAVQVSSTVPSFTLDCATGASIGTFTSFSQSSGSKIINYTGGNGQTYGAISVASTGVTGLTATAPAGTLANGNGSISLAINGVPSTAGTASFQISIGGQTCSFTINVADKFADIDQFTVIQIGSSTNYFASGIPLIGTDATNGGTGSGPSQVKTQLDAVLASLGKPVEHLGLIPSSTSAQGLQKIFDKTNADGKKREVVFIYTLYNASSVANTTQINTIINTNYVSKGKIYFISADENTFSSYAVFSASNYGKVNSYQPKYTIDGNALIDSGDTFPTVYGNVSSSGLLSSQYWGNSLVAPAGASIAATITSPAADSGKPIVFKDMTFNGKVWVFGDTDAYWQFDTGTLGAQPYLTGGCTGTNRDRFNCNLFHYVTRKNLGIPLN